jgi:membrane associated rhomboid family serine protease
VTNEPTSETTPPEAPIQPVPSWRTFPDYPVTAVTAVLAAAVTVAHLPYLLDRDVSFLYDSPLVRHGQVWRLITSVLPHGDPLHLLFNAYWLWIFGTAVERVFGHARTLGLMLVFAYGSSALEYAFLQGGIGLSGVVYGLFGFVWVLSTRDERFRGVLDARTIRLLVVWFFVCIALTVTEVFAVANIAHGSGALLGMLAGLVVADTRRRGALVAAIAAVMVFATWAVTVGRPTVNLSPDGGIEECQLGFDVHDARKPDQAVYWLRLAATYRALPDICWWGLGVSEKENGSPERAIAAFRKGADKGEPRAQAELAGAYDTGSGVDKDPAQAVAWYRKAADQGDALAQNNLAWMLVTSSDPAVRNPKEALAYAQKAVSSPDGAKSHAFLDTLAAAQFANGNCERALKTQQDALAAAPEKGREELQQRLETYRAAVKNSGCHS